MKKITLKNLNLKEMEQLSREQLKNVLGGYMDGTGGGTDGGTSSCPDGKTKCFIDGDDLGCKAPVICCDLAGFPKEVCDVLV